jgi:SWIM zinc finger
MRTKHKEKVGVVESVVSLLERRWAFMAQYRVRQIELNGNKFSVLRNNNIPRSNNDNCVIANVDMEQKRCNCGEWQDHGIPCVHALVVFKSQGILSFEDCLQHVDTHYSYTDEHEMLWKNIVPVCVDRIFPDGSTLPPDGSAIKTAGRPKKQRLRGRSKFLQDPEKSPIVCSRCGKHGHNIRTCLLREAMSANDGAVGRNRKRKVENIKEIDLS